MGSYLSSPVTDKESEEGVQAATGIRFGACAMQGWRVSQEDAHVCDLNFDDHALLFAVFDGHGGAEVAKYCAMHLGRHLKSLQSYKDGAYGKALVEAFLTFDDLLRQPHVLKELRAIADSDKEKADKTSDSDSDDGEDLVALLNEQDIPLEALIDSMDDGAKEELLQKRAELRERLIHIMDSSSSEDEDDDEESEDDDTETEEEETKPQQDRPTTPLLSEIEPAKSGEQQAVEKEAEQGQGDAVTGSAPDPSTETKEEPKLDPSALTRTKPVGAQEDSPGPSSSAGSGSSASHDEDETDKDFNPAAEADSDDEDFEEEDTENISPPAPSRRPGLKRKMRNGKVIDFDDYRITPTPGYDSGATANIALIKDGILYVANVGDSRCVVSKNGQALDMSRDHKPEDPEEQERINKAGGKVTSDGRVNNGLNLSRALGDHNYKRNEKLDLADQMISAKPDVKLLSLDESHEFMVIACDGIWNSMSSQEVVDFVRQRLSDKTPIQICEEMFDKVLAKNTGGDGTGMDNMTCVIVKFPAMKVNGNSVERTGLEEPKKEIPVPETASENITPLVKVNGHADEPVAVNGNGVKRPASEMDGEVDTTESVESSKKAKVE